jgi:hypothetical protein
MTQHNETPPDDLETAAWDWLAETVGATSDEDPSDIAYSADQMVDAFLAGFAASADTIEQQAKRIAELEGARRDDAWQPIETAPKDGTIIDVWRDDTRETVYWGFPEHCCGEMGSHCDSDWHSIKNPGWVCSTFGEFVGGSHDPFTHWRSMPAPPIAALNPENDHVG